MTNCAWVIDDHMLFNAGISRLLIGLNGIEKVLSFSSPQEVIDDRSLSPPKLVIADYFIPGFNIENWMPCLKELYTESPIVVISSSISSLDKERCLKLGATAYFEKHLDPQQVMSGLQQVMADCYEPKGMDSQIARNFSEGRLTNRQIEIIICLSRGLSLKLIAKKLDISTETVKTHISNLYRELNVSSKDEAILWAREHGLV